MAVPVEALTFLAGPWVSSVIAVGLAAIVGIAKLFAWWRANRIGALPGSPTTERYWRSRLDEALGQSKEAPAGSEQAEFGARVTEARIMVEAHEAMRRIGGGRVAGLWLTVVVLMLGASASGSIWKSSGSWVASLMTVLLLTLMAFFEFLALTRKPAFRRRFNVLVTAGRFGHSARVRKDPWWVLRQYELWKTEQQRAGVDLTRPDERKASGRVRWERLQAGTAPWPDEFEMLEDIWAAPEATEPAIALHTPEREDQRR